ncbi:leucine-rich transmembrane [Olea europaea subsp. europaea]|uniref:Leucine-rich transmembrane n=1 Tax=Olea europaea subsp. europaea TaxID=158383 RepID=A0A8S0TKG9_OLEEU|nr:leucine-rich transmembrane [Olea europaea subsp. europaea]
MIHEVRTKSRRPLASKRALLRLRASIIMLIAMILSLPRGANSVDCRECAMRANADLSYNHIRGTLDANFTAQTNLIDLYLGHNQIEYLSERAFLGLTKLQVLELSDNKLKTIHSNAFVPLRTSLYELNIANNPQLTSLPTLGLEGLINLKAFGNNQLRKLPGRLPAARSLALTFAYHCCDYKHDDDDKNSAVGSQSYTDHTRVRFPLGLMPTPTTDEDRPRARFAPEPNPESLNPFRSVEIDHTADANSLSWALHLSNLVSSKLSSLWRSSPEPEVDLKPNRWRSARPSSSYDEANSRNLSEFVLWPTSATPTTEDNQNEEKESDEYSKEGSRETSSPPANLSVAPPGQFRAFLATTSETAKLADARSKRQVAQPPEVMRRRRRRKRHERGPARNRSPRVVIDELVWQMRRIRFAHSRDGPPAPARDGQEVHESRWVGEKNHQEEEFEDPQGDYAAASATTADLVARILRDGHRRALAKREIFGETGGREQSQVVQCLPRPNAFQPCRDLFDSLWLRASIWLVFLFAFLGNICVIVVLGSVRPSSSTSALTSIMWFNAAHSKRHIDVPRFLVLNLALADLLMACYLGILAFVDLSTLGEFKVHAIKWQYSTGCKLAGFLAVLSSELSVFILAIITLERNYAITNAVHLNRRLSLQKAMVIMFFGYVYALAMALMPLNGINDYRKFSICLPLDIDPRNFYASSNLYLILMISINTLSFVLLLSCYLRMYCAIRGSQAWNTNDLKIAKRMSILVVTDFLCWSPLICVALATLFGYHLVGAEGLKFLIIFVLPLNSVANPFLYAITTKKFKRDLAILKKRLHVEQVAGWLARVGSRLACSRAARRKESAEGVATAGLRLPVASTMEQIYYKKTNNNRAGSKQQLVAGSGGGGGGARLAVAQAGSKRAKSKLSRQELLVINSNQNGAAAVAARASNGRVRPSSRPALGARTPSNNNNHLLGSNFQSFERNEERASDYFPLARTHCLACQRRLVAAATSALEPTTSLNSVAPATQQQQRRHIASNHLRRSQTDNSQEEPAASRNFEVLQEHEMILMQRTNCRNGPRIVLDAVEPVVGVAMAPLHLASSLHHLATGVPSVARGQSPLPSDSSLLDLGAESKQRLAVSDTMSNELGDQLNAKKRALSAEANYQRETTPGRPLSTSTMLRPSSGVSCQTVLVAAKSAVVGGSRPAMRSVLLPVLSHDPQAEGSRDPTPNRPASACDALAWPAVSKARGENTKHKSIRATCCSCSCDMIQSRQAGTARFEQQQHHALSQQSSGQQVRGTRSRGQQVVVVSSQRLDEQPHRSSSINRLVLEPLAKAWSNLQLSLQSGLSTVGAAQAQTSNSSSCVQHNEVATARRSTQQVAAGRHRARATTASLARNADDERGRQSSSSSERDPLMLDDEHESVIIDDILQMSSPAKRRLLRGGRRMSRSCDIIIEQSSTATASGVHRNSTTSGTTEQTGSSFYDQNDDQRILLATINQLSARRRRKRGRQATRRARDINSRAAQRAEPGTGARRGSDKRASCTRCRSWSPALLDKLEDCMYQIRSRIPRFNARELQQREPSFEALEQATTTTSSEVVVHEGHLGGPRDEPQHEASLLADQDHDREDNDEQVTTASSSPSSLSASSGAIVDEEDEDDFNETDDLGGLSQRLSRKRRTPQIGSTYQAGSNTRHRLRQQLSGNSDTLSRHTIGTTLTSVSFDSNTNIPAIVSSSSGAGGSGADSQRQSDDDLGRVGRGSARAFTSDNATIVDQRVYEEEGE